MLMLIKTFVSKDIFRKSLVFGIMMLFVGVSVLQQIQSPVKADFTDSLTDTDETTLYIGNSPMMLLLYPIEGDTVKETISIQWTAQDSEDGTNLPIYLYLSNNNGDNCTPFWNNPYENTGELQWNTTQYPDGEYKLLIEAQDSDGNIGVDSCNFQIKNHEQPPVNHEPVKPNQLSGQTNGKPEQEYSYATSTTDPDGDQVYYLWDWGDGNISGWLGPYNSGVIINMSHTWAVKGSYSIKVKAKDIFGAESPWSDPLPMTMPYSYNKPILQFLELLFQRFPHAFPILRHLLGY